MVRTVAWCSLIIVVSLAPPITRGHGPQADSQERPSSPSATPGPRQNPTRIVILGDSTVSDYPADSPLRGWGQVIGQGFTDEVTVRNLAVSGRSTKTFLAEGRL